MQEQISGAAPQQPASVDTDQSRIEVSAAQWAELNKTYEAHAAALIELEKAGWPCRLVELPQAYVDVCAESVQLYARIEQLEKELAAKSVDFIS